MSRIEQREQAGLSYRIRQYRDMAADADRWVSLNAANAAHWRQEAARCRALAAAAEVELQIARQGTQA